MEQLRPKQLLDLVQFVPVWPSRSGKPLLRIALGTPRRDAILHVSFYLFWQVQSFRFQAFVHWTAFLSFWARELNLALTPFSAQREVRPSLK